MEQYAKSLIDQYRGHGVLVDTNLLILLLVGAYDRNRVERTRRIRDRFRAEDFDILVDVLGRFETRVTTPHILTETSNLLSQQLSGYVKDEVFSTFATLVSTDWYERCASAATLVSVPAFLWLGITDVAISDTARGSYLVLTDDALLADHLGRLQVDVLNFNYLRGL